MRFFKDYIENNKESYTLNNNINLNNFSIDFNKKRIKLYIQQNSNIIFNDFLNKLEFEKKIIYRKKTNNIQLFLDEPIYIKLSKENNDIYYDIIFDSNSLDLVDELNKKFCFVEYLLNKALSFNISHYEGNKIFIKSVYLSYRL